MRGAGLWRAYSAGFYLGEARHNVPGAGGNDETVLNEQGNPASLQDASIR